MFIIMQGQTPNIVGDERIDIVLKWLRETIFRLTNDNERFVTKIPGLSVYRTPEPTQPVSCLHEPCICLVVQGKKWILLGKDKYILDSEHFLISSLDLPTTVQIVEATKDKPYMSLTLNIDQQELSKLIVDMDSFKPYTYNSTTGMTTGKVTLPLLIAFQRLIDLNEEPDEIPILAPLIKREIFYHLLLSEQGERLRQIVKEKSATYKITKAIECLKTHYTEPLNVKELAQLVHMSTSSLHHHFKRLTSMSPLQYQKWLRLNEARRLMLTENLDATSAAFRIGYESLSQFSREYRRLFGSPPLQDVKKLRTKD